MASTTFSGPVTSTNGFVGAAISCQLSLLPRRLRLLLPVQAPSFLCLTVWLVRRPLQSATGQTSSPLPAPPSRPREVNYEICSPE